MSRPLYKDRNLHVIFAVTMMAVLGVSSIAPALPKIAKGLGVEPTAIGLLITVFTVPGVVLTPISGVLADRYGRKRIIVPALFLFALAGGATLRGACGHGHAARRRHRPQPPPAPQEV